MTTIGWLTPCARFIAFAAAVCVLAPTVCADDPAVPSLKAAEPATKNTETRPVRIAILNFGPSAEQLAQKDVTDLLGATITPEDWRAVVPMLEKDRVDVVVVRVNSGGGEFTAAAEFHAVFEREFKPRFRTVAWIDSAVTQAAIAILPIEEFYFTPDGYFGWATCAVWSGDPVRTTGASLKHAIQQSETGARLGKRSETIARSLILYEPLSLDINPDTKSVSWRQDEKGQHIVNRTGRIFGIGASDAQRFGLSKAAADTQIELAQALGLERVEWTGQDANDFLNVQMHKHYATMQEIDDEWIVVQLRIIQAKNSTSPKTVRQLAEAAQKSLNTLRRHAKDHPAQWASRGLTFDELSEREATIRRLRGWPTVSATIRAAQQPANSEQPAK